MPSANHSTPLCTSDCWPVPRMVAFKSDQMQLFLFGSVFGVPQGFQAALGFIGFQGQGRL